MNTSRDLAQQLLETQDFNNEEEKLISALLHLLAVADHTEQEKILATGDECDVFTGISRRPILEMLVEDYGIRRIRQWLDQIAETEGED